VFDSIGWGEIIVLALAALFIFGPERLPGLAKDAATGLKRVRSAITGIREQVNESLGDDLPELRDLDLRKYHPKTFIRSQLLGDEDGPTVHRGSAVAAAAAPVVARPRDHAVPPPFDPDAT
jgi:sec-independent protein translocase protein TatB